LLNVDDLAVIGVGSVASFISAAIAVKALIRYVSGHDFKIFAWYRIGFRIHHSRHMVFRRGEVVINLRSLAGSAALCVSGLLRRRRRRLAHRTVEWRRGNLIITEARARPTPPGITVGAVYFSITNAGSKADRLLSVSTPVANKVELHESRNMRGVVEMRELTSVECPPGATVRATPGGLHVMLMGLAAPLAAGTELSMSLAISRRGRTDAQGTGSVNAAAVQATDVAHLIQVALTPIFLISAIGVTLNVLTNRLSRIVDRARVMESQVAHPDYKPEGSRSAPGGSPSWRAAPATSTRDHSDHAIGAVHRLGGRDAVRQRVCALGTSGVHRRSCSFCRCWRWQVR